jgi:hypothetical protein
MAGTHDAAKGPKNNVSKVLFSFLLLKEQNFRSVIFTLDR